MKIITIICLAVVVWGLLGTFISFYSSQCPKLDKVREPDYTGTMNYFIAGLLNQPRGAFSFIDKVGSLRYDGMTYVPYNNLGMDMDAIYMAIHNDIVENKYQRVRIFAISMGNMIIRKFETEPIEGVDFYFYEINPCNSANLVQKKFYWPLKIGTPIASAIEFVLGPIGFIPFIEASGEFFSFRLLIDQLRTIAYFPEYPVNPDNTQIMRRAVIISHDDELLDNAKIREFYTDGNIVEIPTVIGDYRCDIIEVYTHHSDTIGASEDYFRAVYAQLLAENGIQAP